MKPDVLKSKELSNTKDLESLEKKLLSMPQEPCPVTHDFGPGVYLRKVSLPKGALVIGHHQNFEHMNVFTKGRITFFGENGPIELKAPMTLVGKPGRKIAFIHEDSEWINVYSTTETDVEKLEAHYLTKSDSWLLDNKEREKIRLISNNVDQNDYELFLKESNLTEELVRKISENIDDIIDLPFGGYKVKKGKSSIQGTGIFATGDFRVGEMIMPAIANGKKTIGYRFTNHSAQPNAQMVKIKEGDIALVSLREIKGCLGGQDGEEVTIDYRKSMHLTHELAKGK